MESDAISRSALLDNGIRVSCGYNDNGVLLIPMGDVRKSIKGAPALDVAPVVHARWDAEHRCTECICLCTTVKAPQGHLVFVETPYCPNCGARMDGEAE